MSANPYEVLSTGSVTHEPARRGAWRKGDALIVRSQIATLPDICLRCGEAEGTKKLNYNLRCPPQWWMLALPYAAPFAPSVSIRPALCAKHYRHEQRSRWLGHSVMLAAGGSLLIGFLTLEQINELISIFLFVAGFSILPILWVYYRTFRYKVLRASKIKKQDALIEHAPENLLQELPPVPNV